MGAKRMADTPSREKAFEERICDRKVLVYKTLVDPSVVKFIGEKLRPKIFLRFGFLKAKPGDVELSSIEKFYEPFLILDAKYSIEYLRKREVSFGVDPEVREVIILNQSFKPELLEDSKSGAGRVVRLEAQERLTREERVYMVLNKEGREVPVDAVPHAPSEEDPKKILEEFRERVGALEFDPKREIDLVRSRVFRRPPDVFRAIRESFEVSDRSIVYVPVYEITFRNARTGETRKVRIDGVSAKSLAQKSMVDTLTSFFKV